MPVNRIPIAGTFPGELLYESKGSFSVACCHGERSISYAWLSAVFSGRWTAVQAYPFSKVIDIDHATDVEKAERFLEEQTIK